MPPQIGGHQHTGTMDTQISKLVSDHPFGQGTSREEAMATQRRRGNEAGRGRLAKAPWQIPLTGWMDIFWRTYTQFNEDRVLAVSAGVVFYGLLALFPAVTALVSLYGLIAERSLINQQMAFISDLLPSGTYQVVQDQVSLVLSKGGDSLGLAFLFSLCFSLWSANSGTKAVIDALNIVYEEKEKRGFFVFNLVCLAFTFTALAFVILALLGVVAFPIVLERVGMGAYSRLLIQVARWPTLVAIMLVSLALLYRYGPSRRESRWEWLSVGSVLAVLAWLGGSAMLSWYLSRFADYSATYGSLGAAIGLMLWMWISTTVILLGAELNAEIEHQTTQDTTIGPEKPLGARGATMADTVGKSSEQSLNS